ncbi:MAG: CPBP family intramembrane metalloprotease [Phycisphaeraceae bacterium]|nr:CPBP family intramembrane metalloprotease [Phycisphaeraceae bacterium]
MTTIVALGAALVPAAAAMAQAQQKKAVPPAAKLATVISDTGIAVAAAGVIVFLFVADVIRPGSFARRPPRNVVAVPSVIWLCCALLTFLAVVVGSQLVHSLPASMVGEAKALRHEALAQLGGGLLGLGAAAFLAYLLAPRGGPDVGLRVRWSDVPVGLLCAAIAAPLLLATNMGIELAVKASQGAPPPEIAHATLERLVANKTNPWSWVMGVTAIVLLPIVEELIYRVFLQSFLMSIISSTWIALLLCAGAFAMVHYTMVPPYVLPLLFLLGLLMGIAYERTKRLGVPILMHIAFNAANVGMALWAAKPR